MKNKKMISVILALVLTLMMTVVMTGCGQKQQPAEDQSTQTQTEQPATEETTAPETGVTATAPADGSTAATQNEYIGEDKALEIAVADSGLKKDQISNSFVKLDYDDDTGRYEYEVKFYKDTTEYEYDIDAITGQITDKDIDFD